MGSSIVAAAVALLINIVLTIAIFCVAAFSFVFQVAVFIM